MPDSQYRLHTDTYDNLSQNADGNKNMDGGG